MARLGKHDEIVQGAPLFSFVPGTCRRYVQGADLGGGCKLAWAAVSSLLINDCTQFRPYSIRFVY